MVSFYKELLCDSARKIFDFAFKIIASIDRGF